jgi:hypothetical protein
MVLSLMTARNHLPLFIDGTCGMFSNFISSLQKELLP